jgi:hypothetical protein
LIGRKRGDVELTREWARRTLALSEKAKNPFYRGAALGSLAWAELQTGNEEQLRVFLAEGLALNDKVPSPLRFLVLGPALALEVQNKNWDVSIGYVKSLLHPSQQKMPDELQSMLEGAVAKWEAGEADATEALLVQSIELMKQMRLGYV